MNLKTRLQSASKETEKQYAPTINGKRPKLDPAIVRTAWEHYQSFLDRLERDGDMDDFTTPEALATIAGDIAEAYVHLWGRSHLVAALVGRDIDGARLFEFTKAFNSLYDRVIKIEEEREEGIQHTWNEMMEIQEKVHTGETTERFTEAFQCWCLLINRMVELMEAAGEFTDEDQVHA